jgi:peptidoglycan/LPS O-acetylase OafA/YrhL
LGNWWLSQPAFIFGLLTAKYENNIRFILLQHPFKTIGFIVGFFFLGVLLHYTNKANHFSSLVMTNLFPLSILFFIYAYGSISNRTIRYLGKISLDIYIIHGVIIMPLREFGLPWYTFTIFAFLLVIPLAAVTHKLNNCVISSKR